MKRDMARVYTDRKLNELTKELERVYSRALDETQAAWNKFMAKHEGKANTLYKAVRDAETLGDDAQIAAARKAYKEYLTKTMQGDRAYKQTVDDISYRLAKVDRDAYNIVNGYLPDIYAANYNSLRLPKGYVLKIVDPHTVTNLAVKEVDVLKYTVWNKKRFNAEILRGILQGDSIPKLSKRLSPMVGGNEAAAVRAARTAVTSAENGGRLDSMEAARELGLIYKKEWVATHDSRTRESHLEIDGEQVFLDEAFSNGCDYPADPKGDPEEVYNCRCTMNRILWGIEEADGSIRRV